MKRFAAILVAFFCVVGGGKPLQLLVRKHQLGDGGDDDNILQTLDIYVVICVYSDCRDVKLVREQCSFHKLSH